MESPLNALCDSLIFVDSSQPARLDRVSRDRGWNAETLEGREAAQTAVPEKRAQADHIIANDGSLEDLQQRTEGLFAILRSSPPQ